MKREHWYIIKRTLEQMAEISAKLTDDIEDLSNVVDTIEGLTEFAKPIETAPIHLSDLKPGEKFNYGGFVWVKLDGNDCGTLCLTADVVGYKVFDQSTQDDWREASLREWLNESFWHSLVEAEVKCMRGGDNRLLPIISDLTADDGLKDYGISQDFIALLSCDMYRRYRHVIPALDDWYWTLTPITCNDRTVFNVCYVTKTRKFYNCRPNLQKIGVRPICMMKSDTLLASAVLDQ